MQFQQTPRAQEAARPLGEGRASDPFLLTPSHPKNPPTPRQSGQVQQITRMRVSERDQGRGGGREGSLTPRGRSQEERQPSDITWPRGTSWGPEVKRTLQIMGVLPALEKRCGDTATQA